MADLLFIAADDVWEKTHSCLRPFEWLVLLRIIYRAGTSGKCFESVENIANAIGAKPRSVRYALRQLALQSIISNETDAQYKTTVRRILPIECWIVERIQKTPLHSDAVHSHAPLHDDAPLTLHDGAVHSDAPLHSDAPTPAQPCTPTPAQPCTQTDPFEQILKQEMQNTFPFGEQSTSSDACTTDLENEVKDDFLSNPEIKIEKPKKLVKKKTEVVPQKDDTPKNVSKPANDTFRLLEYYDEGFRKTYNSEPLKHAREDFGIAKNILERCAKDFSKACQLVDYFFSMKNRYYVQRGHALKVLIGDLHKIHTEFESSKMNDLRNKTHENSSNDSSIEVGGYKFYTGL